MMATRWFAMMLGGFALCACQDKGSNTAETAPAVAAAGPVSVATPQPYSRCPADNYKCIDLQDALDPGEHSSVEAHFAAIPLKMDTHVADGSVLTGTDAVLTDLQVLPSGKLIAVGGSGLAVARAASEAADTWHVDNYSHFADSLRGVSFHDDQHGFAIGDGARILRTQDGGAHWEVFNRSFTDLKNSEYRDLKFEGAAYSVAFADPLHGVVGGEGRLLRTSDGGQQWQRVAQALDGIAIQRVTFVDAKRGWAVGSSETVLRTDDAGEHWVVVPLRVGASNDHADRLAHLMAVSFGDAMHGCIGGGFKVWCSQDGGATWTASDVAWPKGVDTGEDMAITALTMRDANQGWLVTREGARIFQTDDGGRHWSLWMSVPQASQGKLSDANLWGLALGHDRAWAVGVGVPAKPDDGVAPESKPIVVSWKL
jgi:photosystem II stability/assembly factor-like uncharacterized protein